MRFADHPGGGAGGVRNGLLVALAAIAMLLWPWLDAEILQSALAGIVLVIAVVSLLRVATARKRTSTASVLPVICMAALAFALTARNEVAQGVRCLCGRCS